VGRTGDNDRKTWSAWVTLPNLSNFELFTSSSIIFQFILIFSNFLAQKQINFSPYFGVVILVSILTRNLAPSSWMTQLLYRILLIKVDKLEILPVFHSTVISPMPTQYYAALNVNNNNNKKNPSWETNKRKTCCSKSYFWWEKFLVLSEGKKKGMNGEK
jgi:hypothetical protein